MVAAAGHASVQEQRSLSQAEGDATGAGRRLRDSHTAEAPRQVGEGRAAEGPRQLGMTEEVLCYCETKRDRRPKASG